MTAPRDAGRGARCLRAPVLLFALGLGLALLPFALGPSALAQPSAAPPPRATDTLHVTLDLRGPIRDGWLDPSAETVGLRGDAPPLSWNATLAATDPDGDGRYHAAVPLVIEGDSLTLAYKIKVDGTGNPGGGWQEGRNHRVTVRRGEAARIQIAWGDAPAPVASTITGRVEVLRDVEGEGLLPRDLYVYLPPGYAETDRRYPVLYMHDGQTVFDAAAAGNEWQMDEAAERLIRSGEIEPLIIVGISNTETRVAEYTPTQRTWRHVLHRAEMPAASGPLASLTGAFTVEGDTLRVEVRGGALQAQIPGSDTWQRLDAQPDGGYLHPQAGVTFRFDRSADPAPRVVASKPPEGGDGNRYGAFLIGTVKPMIDARYRTHPEARSTGLGGASLGGLITMHLGLQHPDVFGRLLVASPSVWWDDAWILGAARKHGVRQQHAGRQDRAPAAAARTFEQRLWLDVGTGEPEAMVTAARALRDTLRQAGWPPAQIRYVEAPGAGHSERAWAARVPDMLRFLMAPEPQPDAQPRMRPDSP